MVRHNISRISEPLVHILFWTIYLLLNGIAWTTVDVSYLQSSQQGLLFLPVKMIVAYLNFYWLMPAYLFKKRYAKYALLIVTFMVLGGIIQHILFNLYSTGTYNIQSIGSRPNQMLLILFRYVVPINSILFFTSMIKMLQQWYLQQAKSETLAKEKIGAELDFLKAQVHPHFLFNTLNNLYSLTLKQSDLAPKVVLKLSELLNYMLYEASEKEVLLSREIDHFSNYIEIERIRYGNRLDLSLNISGEIYEKSIQPLILLPFIENSFKHSLSNELEKAWITIDLKIKNNILAFKVENSKGPSVREPDTLQPNGIGLVNVKRRLELLYPGKYDLNIQDENEYFAIDLKLQLNNLPIYA